MGLLPPIAERRWCHFVNKSRRNIVYVSACKRITGNLGVKRIAICKLSLDSGRQETLYTVIFGGEYEVPSQNTIAIARLQIKLWEV